MFQEYWKSDNRSLLILGAGGLGEEVAEIAQMTGLYARIAFLDDAKTEGASILGRIAEAEELVGQFPYAICAIGNNESRLRIHQHLKEIGYQTPTLVHPRACISPTAALGDGCIVRAGAVVSRNVRIADACLINVNASIDHDCVIGAGSHIPMGCVVRNAVTLPVMSLFRPNQVVETNE